MCLYMPIHAIIPPHYLENEPEKEPLLHGVYPSMHTPCHPACALRHTNMRTHGQAGECVGLPPSPSMPLLELVPLVLVVAERKLAPRRT